MRAPSLQFSLLTFPILATLSACSSLPGALPSLQASIEANAEMIESQRALLEQQSEQMELLGETQILVSGTLEQIQTQLAGLQKSNNSVAQENKRKTQPQKATQKPSVREAEAPLDGKILMGRNEWVWLDLLGQSVEARVDTGVRASVLTVTNIQPFERNGKKWVRFQLSSVEAPQLEVPLVRMRGNASEKNSGRPVVKLTARVGGIVEEAEFTLSDKENATYPIQLGRDFLRDIAIVDVAQKFVQPKFDGQTVAR